MSLQHPYHPTSSEREDLQSMLGEPWEDVESIVRAGANRAEIPSLRRTTSDNGNIDASTPLRDGGVEENVPKTRQSMDVESNSMQATARHQRSSEPWHGTYQEVDSASTRTELALDNYLACYCQVQASMDEIFAHLRDHLQNAPTNPPSSELLLQRVDDNQRLLDSRSSEVKEAKQQRMLLLAGNDLQQQEASFFGCNMCFGVDRFDDDGKSDTSSLSDPPTVVEEYFEAARSAFVENERLLDLDDEYNELVAERQQSAARDGWSESIAETEEAYKRKRLELTGALAVSHYRLDVERRACRDQGINPERYRYRRFSCQ